VALAESETGMPVLVENLIGKGRVWTLVAGEYWGAAALDNFRNQLGDTLTAMHKGDPSISGDTKEVDYHVYELPDGITRIALINTDWTKAGNTKDIVLRAAGKEIPLTVKEGVLSNLLIDKNLIINYSVPGAGARIINSNENQITLSLSGTGEQVFILNSDKLLKIIDINSKTVILKDNNLTIDFGKHWEEKIVQIGFVN